MPDIAASIVWKLARRHSWGSPIPGDRLVRMVAQTEDHDTVRRVLETEVLALPFVARSSEGVYIPNGRDTHIAAAEWLRDHTNLDELKLNATLSRLPDEWPRRQ